jgi:hypothetical protein
MNTQPPSAAAGEHFADAERALAALTLVKRGERDRQVQVALVHAVLCCGFMRQVALRLIIVRFVFRCS